MPHQVPPIVPRILIAAVFSILSYSLSCADEPSDAVEPRGLVLDYDFTRGSLPTESGRVKDLSEPPIDATLRPIKSTPTTLPPAKRTGWRDHQVLQGNGEGGWL